MPEEPSLYGIINSNRTGDDLWGKNQFNSSFPVSLACYMRDNDINAIYLSLNENLEVVANELHFNEVFNTSLDSNDIYFSFESKFDPYQVYSYDDISGIDLVVKDTSGNFLQPLEIKLTVIPDNSTYQNNESEWGSEIVIRPPTTKYCGLGMVHSCINQLEEIRNIFEPVCHDVRHWDSIPEINSKMDDFIDALNIFESQYIQFQKPLLLQPIWKTQGKSPLLAENAFDIFVWSDFALSRLFIDASNNRNDNVTRLMRSTARLTRFLYEISTRRITHLNHIYTEMTFGHQTDKEFSVNGSKTVPYMNHVRRFNPILPQSVLSNIILGGGEEKLSPERRFDQTIYYTIANR